MTNKTFATAEDILNLPLGGKDVVKTNGQDFLITRTYDSKSDTHLWEVSAYTLPGVLVSMEWLAKQGYDLCLTLNNRFPLKLHQGTTYWVVRPDGANTPTDKSAGRSDEASDAASSSKSEEVSVTDEVVQEVTEDSAKPSLSTEDLLEGPNWSKAKTMSKKDLEDYADKYQVDLNTDDTKGEMLESFKAQWETKLKG